MAKKVVIYWVVSPPSMPVANEGFFSGLPNKNIGNNPESSW